MNFSSKDIIEIYSYTEDEQKNFAYLRKYMKLITPKLREIERDREKLKKFALSRRTELFHKYSILKVNLVLCS